MTAMARTSLIMSILSFYVLNNGGTRAEMKEECSLEKVKLDAIFVIDGSYSIKPVDFKLGNQMCSYNDKKPF